LNEAASPNSASLNTVPRRTPPAELRDVNTATREIKVDECCTGEVESDAAPEGLGGLGCVLSRTLVCGQDALGRQSDLSFLFTAFVLLLLNTCSLAVGVH
jgi:hypothetical protein